MDPIDLKTCINRNVVLETKDGKMHEGTVYTVDPVSESVVICQKKEDSASAEIIFKHAINNVISIGELNPISLVGDCEITNKNLSKLREHLKNWLQKNLIPVEDSGDCLKIGGQLTITPPYGTDNCISSNEMVLNKITKLIERMPS